MNENARVMGVIRDPFVAEAAVICVNRVIRCGQRVRDRRLQVRRFQATSGRIIRQ